MKKKVLLASVLMVVIGCGGGGGGGGAKLDPEDVVKMVNSPTGTLTEENADDVVNEFIALLSAEENIPSTPFVGGFSPQEKICDEDTRMCCDVGKRSAKCSCPDGGGLYVSIDDPECENGCTIEYSYNNCSFSFDGYECAIDGDGGMWMASMYGEEMAITFSGTVCGQPVDIACYFDGTDMWYVVEVNGETFAVTGDYSNGYGWVYIKDSTGKEYYCSIENDEIFCEL